MAELKNKARDSGKVAELKKTKELAGGVHPKLPLAAERIANAQKLLLTCHRGPDGDSVGSLVALAALCKHLGKSFVLFNPDLVPRSLKWLPHSRSFVQQLKKNARFDLTLVVDCGDPQLLGDKFPEKEVTGEMIALDHHCRGREFGDIFISDPTVSAIGVMVAQLYDLLECPISNPAAMGLYAAIVSDTGGFRYPNTNAQVLQLASRLVEEGGVDPAEVSQKMSTDSSPGRYRLIAQVLTDMKVSVGGKLAIIQITPEILRKCSASWDDTEGLINFARSLRGVECGVLIAPSKYGGIRVSMRTRGATFDAGKICYELGGGGHQGAAGCTLEGNLEEATKLVEDKVASIWAQATGQHKSS